jgi:hypothetical protein
MADVCVRLDIAHHHETWRTDSGRQDHTIWPYADRTDRVRDVFAHGRPPCKTLRADVTHVHRRPARVVTIAIRPSSSGRVTATHTPFPNFGKAEYFQASGLTDGWRVLLVGQYEIS